MPPGTCRICDAPREPCAGDGSVCASCRLDLYPPIQARGGRWSPFGLGLMSLVCDVLMIPSALAIFRGVSELREVGRRQDEGYWDPEHPVVRSGAVWGILLGAVFPLFIALSVVVATLGSAFEIRARAARRAADVYQDSELVEVLDRIHSDNPEERRIALEHLDELSRNSELPNNAHGSILAELARPDRLPSIEQREARGALVAAASSLRPSSLPRDLLLERLATYGDVIDMRGKTALVDAAAGQGTVGSLGIVLELMTSDDPPPLPIERLADVPDLAPEYLPALLALDIDSPVRRDALRLAGRICAGPFHGPTALAPARGDLLVDWARARGELLAMAAPADLAERMAPERRRRVAYAEDAVYALGCAVSEPVERVLANTARRSPVPEVALAAAIVLDRRGRPMRSAAARRWALDPLTRRTVASALDRARLGRLDDALSPAALAESDLLLWMSERELVPRSVSHELLQTRPDEAGARRVIHVFVAEIDGAPRRFAVGPYDELRHPSTDEALVVAAGDDLDADWGGVSAALLVDRLLSEVER